MHAAALIMCVVVAGADVRESIATPQALSDLLMRDAKQTSEVTWKFLEGGATLETTLHFGQEKPQILVSRLVVVPCPGHPNLILAGHVVPPTKEEKIQAYVGPTNFCALIDVDLNLIVSLDTFRGVNYLPGQDKEDLTKALEKLAQQYCDRVAADPQKYGKAFFLEEVKQTFIDPPAVTIDCFVENFDWGKGGFNYRLQLSGGNRRMKQGFTVRLRDLLTSELAVPAAKYFETQDAAARKEGAE